MIEVSLRIERDIDRHPARPHDNAWVDVTSVTINEELAVPVSYNAYAYRTREEVLLDMMRYFGYNVQIEEILVTDE